MTHDDAINKTAQSVNENVSVDNPQTLGNETETNMENTETQTPNAETENTSAIVIPAALDRFAVSRFAPGRGNGGKPAAATKRILPTVVSLDTYWQITIPVIGEPSATLPDGWHYADGNVCSGLCRGADVMRLADLAEYSSEHGLTVDTERRTLYSVVMPDNCISDDYTRLDSLRSNHRSALAALGFGGLTTDETTGTITLDCDASLDPLDNAARLQCVLALVEKSFTQSTMFRPNSNPIERANKTLETPGYVEYHDDGTGRSAVKRLFQRYHWHTKTKTSVGMLCHDADWQQRCKSQLMAIAYAWDADHKPIVEYPNGEPENV